MSEGPTGSPGRWITGSLGHKVPLCCLHAELGACQLTPASLIKVLKIELKI